MNDQGLVDSDHHLVPKKKKEQLVYLHRKRDMIFFVFIAGGIFG